MAAVHIAPLQASNFGRPQPYEERQDKRELRVDMIDERADDVLSFLKRVVRRAFGVPDFAERPGAVPGISGYILEVERVGKKSRSLPNECDSAFDGCTSLPASSGSVRPCRSCNRVALFHRSAT